MGLFDWFFGLFDPLLHLVFPKEQFRQMPRPGIGSGLRRAIGHSRLALMRKGQIRQARMPVGPNPELPRSSVQQRQSRMPVVHGIRPRAMLPVTSRPQSGFFSSSRQKQRLRRRI